MSRLVHFELTGDDVSGLTQFYCRIFGWSGSPSPYVPDYDVIDLGGGGGAITGAVMARKYQRQPAILWFEVPDLDAVVAKVSAAGGRAVNRRNTIPGLADVIYVADPEGTVFGLRQPIGGR
jgi:predicted enzyme related to lactoylglutathione lyase